MTDVKIPFPFTFLRHGQTDWNRDRLVMGGQDIPLNATGRDQAAQAARLLDGQGIASIWASPLSRTRETAWIVAERLGLTVSLINNVAERNWGIFEGKTSSVRDGLTGEPEGGENTAEFISRTVTGLSAIGGPRPSLLVAHSGTFRALCRHMKWSEHRLPVPNAQPILVEAGGWTVLGDEEAR